MHKPSLRRLALVEARLQLIRNVCVECLNGADAEHRWLGRLERQKPAELFVTNQAMCVFSAAYPPLDAARAEWIVATIFSSQKAVRNRPRAVVILRLEQQRGLEERVV